MQVVDASVEVPGSKSITNRALVCAALANGESDLRGVAPGDDTTHLLECLRALGVAVGTDDRTSTARVTGTDGVLAPGPARLHAGLAGTTSRFVTALAALGPGPYVVDGDPPLRTRPMSDLHDALGALGARLEAGERAGHLPVRISGPVRGGTIELPGHVSSQYLTALMLIGPYLAEGLRIELTSPLVSRPYVEMTASVMASFGHAGVHLDEHRVAVSPGGYAGRHYEIEPDASSASYPLAIAAIRGGRVRVAGITRSSQQGDACFADLLGRMGCVVDWDDGGVSVTRDPGQPLRGIEVDLADASDLVPSLVAVACLATSPTTVRGIGFIRGKESDRIGDLAAELARLGADVRPMADGLEVHPAGGRLRGARLDTHHDHRLAMAFGVMGSVVDGIEVDDPSVVSKSWPGFWHDLDELLGR